MAVAILYTRELAHIYIELRRFKDLEKEVTCYDVN